MRRTQYIRTRTVTALHLPEIPLHVNFAYITQYVYTCVRVRACIIILRPAELARRLSLSVRTVENCRESPAARRAVGPAAVPARKDNNYHRRVLFRSPDDPPRVLLARVVYKHGLPLYCVNIN